MGGFSGKLAAYFQKTSLYEASSKTLTSRPGATEPLIAGGALREQSITPGAPRIIPGHLKRVRITLEQHGAGRDITEHQGAPRSSCLFNDLFFISKWSFYKQIHLKADIGRETC